MVLRELLVDRLSRHYGPSWWKRALPAGAIQQKYKSARTYEEATPWVRHTPHHPIYFIDFPELVTVIERTENWTVAFAPTFHRRDLFVAALRQLEPLRNTVAHNRRLADADADFLDSIRQQLYDTMGAATFMALLERCTCAPDLPARLRALLAEAEFAYTICSHCQELTQLVNWHGCIGEWWFDDEYLLADLSPIRVLFESLVAYSGLERGRGCGPRLQKWIDVRRLPEQYRQALDTFRTLLKERRK